MIPHKHESTSNPKNAHRHDMVNRWKWGPFIKEKKWMSDGLSVRILLLDNCGMTVMPF